MAYENLFQNRGFFRDYEPVVLNTHLPKIAETLRGRYDEGVAAKSLLDRAMGSVRTIGLDDAAINNARMKMDQTINGRVDFENMGKVITDATTGFLTDHNVLNAIDSRKNWEEGEALRTKMSAELGADNVYDFNQRVKKDAKGKAEIDPVTGAPIMEHASDSWDSGSKGIYRANIARRQDLEGRINNLISDVAKDGGATMRRAAMAAGWTPEEQALIDYAMPLYAYTSVGVSKAKIQALTDALSTNLYNSPEGRQFIAANDQLFVNPLTGTTYTEDESKKILKNMLYNVGSKQEGMVSNMFKITDASGLRGSATEPSASTDLFKIPSKNEYSRFDTLLDESKFHSTILGAGRMFDEKTGKFNEGSVGEYGMQQRPVKVQKLEEAMKSNNMDNIDFNNYNTSDIAGWVLTSPTLAKAFPRKAGDSDEAHTKKVFGALKDRIQTYDVLPPNQKAVADVAQSLIQTGSVRIYQENGKEFGSYSKWLDTNSAGLNFQTESGLEKALLKSLAGEKEGKMQGEQPAGVTVLITSGKHAGLMRHTFSYDGDQKSILFEPLAGSQDSFELSRTIAAVRGSLNPYEEKIIHGVDRSGASVQGKVRNRPVIENGTYRVVTEAVVKDASGKEVVKPIDQIEEMHRNMVIDTWSQYNNQLGSMWRNMYLKSEVKPR